jgi:hypothetical protein
MSIYTFPSVLHLFTQHFLQSSSLGQWHSSASICKAYGRIPGNYSFTPMSVLSSLLQYLSWHSQHFSVAEMANAPKPSHCASQGTFWPRVSIFWTNCWQSVQIFVKNTVNTSNWYSYFHCILNTLPLLSLHNTVHMFDSSFLEVGSCPQRGSSMIPALTSRKRLCYM